MEIHGTLVDNLQAAFSSARRLRGQHVYPETLNHWRELLLIAHARLEMEDNPRLRSLADGLERELGCR